jgi:hydroxypyruvate isomerase
MKLAANLSMLFGEVEFLDRFAAAANAGFKAVEYLLPYDYEASELAERLEAHGLTQALFNMPVGDWNGGERGLACLPDRVSEFREGVGKAAEYATALGCGRVNALAGLVPEGSDPEELTGTLTDNLTYAANELEKLGIRAVTEPINDRVDIPGFFLTSTNQARQIIEATGSKNLFIQYDIYHMQIMEGDLARTIEANLDLIDHIQLADNPGRHEPGTGEINYPYLLSYLDELGYDGFVGCEYKPIGDTADGLGWAKEYLA